MASKVQDLTSNWDRRQTKSKLQKATIRAFGHIHDDSSSIESIEKMMKLLELVISCLPLNQKKLYNAQKCYPGFLAWNKYWKECYAVDLKDKNDLDSLSNVDVYYEKYLRKEQYKISRLVTNDLNESVAMETIEKRIENKSRFPTSFWQDTSR